VERKLKAGCEGVSQETSHPRTPPPRRSRREAATASRPDSITSEQRLGSFGAKDLIARR
jgi:hypothetical protein